MKKRIDHWLLSERSLSRQTDIIVLVNILVACWVLFLILKYSVISIEPGPGRLTIFDAFNALFSSFASVMIVLSWIGSKDLTSKHVEDGGFYRPEMDLIWAAWAILVWQVSTVVDFYLEGTPAIFAGVFFSSLNNMLFLWAVSDFHFENEDRVLRTWRFFNFFQKRDRIFYITVFVIIVSWLLAFFHNYIELFSIKQLFAIEYSFDFLYSTICVFILYLGFKGVVEERYIDKFLNKEYGHKFKTFVLSVIIGVPFLITFFHGVILMFPGIGNGFFELGTKHLAQGILNQFYRSTIVVLFFLLEISWVRIKRDQVYEEKKKDLEYKDQIIGQKNIELERKIKTLKSTKGQLHKERKKLKKTEGQNRTLRNEISHRFKNHLRALSVSVDHRLKKYGSDKSSVVFKELVAEKGRIEATLSIHEHLDKKGSSEDVNFFDYLEDLCFKLKDAFYFPHNGFVYSLDEKALDRTISYADARGIGISLTELVINTDQHAYDSLHEKYVEITIKMDNDFHLSISDRGKGISETAKKDFKNGKGFKFVSDIIEVQLEGKFKISNKEGEKGRKSKGGKGVLFEVIVPAGHLEFKK